MALSVSCSSCMMPNQHLSSEWMGQITKPTSLAWSSSFPSLQLSITNSQSYHLDPQALIVVQAAWTRRSRSEAAKNPRKKSWKQRTDMTIGKLIAERSKEADVYAVSYEPKKGERVEGKLGVILDTIKENEIVFV